MSFSFRPRESVPAGVRRIAHEQFDRAIRELTDPNVDRPEAIHQARKRIKKTRALLRLVRNKLTVSYEAENSSLRNTARRLSGARDAEALLESLGTLEDRIRSKISPRAYEQLHASFIERRDAMIENDAATERKVREVVERLHHSKQHAENWCLKAQGFAAISSGLRKGYRRGRKTRRRAYAKPSIESFHEWRKRAKDHWYHVRLLRNIWPAVMSAREGVLKQLTQTLGADHDLSMLRNAVEQETVVGLDKRTTRDLLKLIDREKRTLRQDAHILGERVYAESPDAMHRRLKAYWNTWALDAADAARG